MTDRDDNKLPPSPFWIPILPPVYHQYEQKRVLQFETSLTQHARKIHVLWFVIVIHCTCINQGPTGKHCICSRR